MKSVFPILFFFIFQFSNGQLNKWQISSHWKLYDIHKSSSLRYSVDTLAVFRYMELPNNDIQYFLKELKLLPKEKAGVWMGSFVASCEINKRLRKIDISSYGGFIYDEEDKEYYQLPESMRNTWLDYLNGLFDKMPAK